MSNGTAPPILSSASREAKTIWARAERRSEPRCASDQFAYLCYRPEPDATCQTVRVWNVTSDSLGLFLDRPIKESAVFYLQFQHLVVQDRIATAIHVTKQEENWLVGCTLDRPFNDGELRALTM